MYKVSIRVNPGGDYYEKSAYINYLNVQHEQKPINCAGDYERIIHEISENLNIFGTIDFTDDKCELLIDKLSEIEKFGREYIYVMVVVGNTKKRREFTMKMEESYFRDLVLI